MTEFEAVNNLFTWCLYAGLMGLLLVPFFINRK